MADLRFHPEAQAEYEAAVAWYQSRSPRAVARFEAEMERVLGLIGSNPDMYAKYDDAHRFAGLHRFPYSVVYRVEPDRIDIVAIAHSSRSAGYWQGRAFP